MNTLKQQCMLYMVWLTWLGIPILAILMGWLVGWWALPFVLVVGAFAQYLYVKIFPKVSGALGYGSVADEAVPSAKPAATVGKVTLYTANVCPFCPLVRQRLQELRKTMGFELSEVDVTFQPGLVREKGFKSVPVVENGGKYWFGNGTTAQLAAFLTQGTVGG